MRPEAGYQIHAGNNAVLAVMTSQVTSDPSRLSRGMRWSVQCREELLFNDLSKIEDSLQAHPRLRNYLTSDYGPEQAICTLWGAGKAGSVILRRGKGLIPAARSARLARGLAWLAAALNLFFLIGLALFLRNTLATDRNMLLFGLPSAARPLLLISLLTAGLSVALLVLTVLAWRNRYWTAGGRVYYTLVTLASLSFVGWLSYVGLLKL